MVSARNPCTEILSIFRHNLPLFFNFNYLFCCLEVATAFAMPLVLLLRGRAICGRNVHHTSQFDKMCVLCFDLGVI